MPPTLEKASSMLGIRLDSNGTTFSPGSTVAGCVYRQAHIVSAEAIVKVTILGRAKTKVVAAPSIRGVATVYRGRSILVDEKDYVQTLFQGPLHIPPIASTDGIGHRWPFALTLPLQTTAMGGSDEQGEADQPPERTDQQFLPASFTMNRAGFGARDEGFIEYTIKAELQSKRQGAFETVYATLPITIQINHPGPPVTDFRLTRYRLYGWISSYSLLPGISPARPTISHKAKLLFSSSKMPVFAGNLEVDTPAVIQLENPNPMPIRMQFVPDPKVMKDSPIDGIPQKLQLQALTMEIQTATEIKCDGVETSWAAISPKTLRVSVWSCLAFGPGTRPLYIPCAGDGPPIDVGRKVNLRIGRTGLMGKAYPQGDVHASFSTRHIKYSHRISYELRAVVAGEVLKFKWDSQATVLPPANDVPPGDPDWLQTPEGTPYETDVDETPPPAFQDAWLCPRLHTTMPSVSG
ncbi:hypothetical protein EV126DRAFT_410181 [Verticillium dahliae]|nr:hypothetical protein EV126DRAFT_437351 [Verticillium dahliae]KAH6706824.1 hypothetical protein EV126DRAFT_410181 [Verticillium dahliae]